MFHDLFISEEIYFEAFLCDFYSWQHDGSRTTLGLTHKTAKMVNGQITEIVMVLRHEISF